MVWVLVQGDYLFRSSDQGATWQQRTWVPYRGGGGNPVISFVDDKFGWALFPGLPGTQCQRAGAQLWRTSDGAAAWQLIYSVSDQSNGPTGLTFDQCKDYTVVLDAANGFVAGHDTARRPIISRTTDGGVTLSQSKLPDPPDCFIAGGGNSLQVLVIRRFGATLLATAESPAGSQYVFRSTDAGATWSYAATVAVDPYRLAVLVEETRWLFIGNDGLGQETTDGGKSWHTWTSYYQDAAGVASTFVFASPQVVFADAMVGYATVRGSIQRSVDGGGHWETIKTPGTYPPG